MNEKLTACLVGSLVGDGWMKLPGVCLLSQWHDLSVVAGSYALPVWQWGLDHLENAHYKIVEVIEDPDKHDHQYCPGKGHPSMDLALSDVRKARPEETVVGGDQIRTAYYSPTPYLYLKQPIQQGDWIAIQPFTKHNWKNLDDVLLDIKYPGRVKVLGLPGEIRRTSDGWEDLSGASFDEQVAAVAGCRLFVGIGSAWSNVATLFHKRTIHVSYTADLRQFTNPRMIQMVTPSREEIQTEVDRWG